MPVVALTNNQLKLHNQHNHLKRLITKHQQIAAELPEDLSATPAAVLATLRFMGISAKPPPGKQRQRKPRAPRGGGGGERRRWGEGVGFVRCCFFWEGGGRGVGARGGERRQGSLEVPTI